MLCIKRLYCSDEEGDISSNFLKRVFFASGWPSGTRYARGVVKRRSLRSRADPPPPHLKKATALIVSKNKKCD